MYSNLIASLIEAAPGGMLGGPAQTLSSFTFVNLFYAAIVVVAMYMTGRLSRPILDALGRRVPRWSSVFKILQPVFRFGPWLIGAALIFSIFSPRRDSFLAVLASGVTGLWDWVGSNW